MITPESTALMSTIIPGTRPRSIRTNIKIVGCLRSIFLFFLIITICLEALATGPLNRWTYSAAMPTIPYIGTGLLPVLQWLVLPLIVVGIVKRQIGQ
jgi:hypothetical protein